jgi:hypothetical protein
MTLSKLLIIGGLVVFLSNLGQSSIQPQESHDSCREFVESFYHWYIPKAFDAQGDSWNRALKRRRSSFSRELYRNLSEDFEAQAKASGELVGLDFDPFLGGQDLRDKYVFSSAKRDGSMCQVEIHGVSSGKKENDPDVIPELILSDGKWIFVNFHYRHSNLLGVLKNLREMRKKQGAP